MYAAANLQIKSQFKNLTSQYLKSTIEEVNFFKSEDTVGKINNFVNNATNSLIQKALDQVSPDTRLILVNAIYFKGPWKYPFIETLTKPRDFYIDNSTKIQAISMYSDDLLNVKYFPELESDVLDLPYKNEKMSMIIILPDKTTDVLQVEKKLKNFETKLLVEKLQSTDRYTTETFLPKFELSLDLEDVTKTLKSVGVSSIFESNADLSNISEEDLFVSSIKHKAVVKVKILSNSFFQEIHKRVLLKLQT
jgi:serine protease inhibitor